MKTILTFILLLIFTSCGLYRQNVVNVPILKQKGQTQIGGHASFTGVDGQASYAITKNVALMANYSNIGTKKISYSSVNFSIDKHYFGEGGIGYFKKTSKDLFMDFFLIAGNGMTSNFVQGLDTVKKITTQYRQAFYNRYCFQVDFGRIKDKLEYAFTPRVMVVNYFNMSDSEVNTYKGLPDVYIYADMSLTLRYSLLKFLKLTGQLNATLPITGLKSGYYEFSPFNCSLGLIFNFNLCTQKNNNIQK